MTERTRRAVKVVSSAGGVAALRGLFSALVLPLEDPVVVCFTCTVLVPPTSFALFFTGVFPLASLPAELRGAESFAPLSWRTVRCLARHRCVGRSIDLASSADSLMGIFVHAA